MQDSASSSKSLLHTCAECASTTELVEDVLLPGKSKSKQASYHVIDSPRKEGKALSRRFIIFLWGSIALTAVTGASLLYSVFTGYSLFYPSIIMVLFLMGLGWTATAIASAISHEKYS